MKTADEVQNCLLIGVTGGIASGKSTVVKIFKKLGMACIDFDLIARQVVVPGQAAFNDIVAHFGPEVLDPSGALDRKKMAAIVFSNTQKRKELESITHPRINAAYCRQLEDLCARKPGRIIMVDIPLLFEGDLEHLFHKTLLVYIPAPLQIERLMQRDQISLEEAQKRLKAQMPIDAKLKRADFVIHNEGGLESTCRQVEAFLDSVHLRQ